MAKVDPVVKVPEFARLLPATDSIEDELRDAIGRGNLKPQPIYAYGGDKPTPEQSVAQWIVDMPYTNLKPMCEGIAAVAKQRGNPPETFLDFVEILHTWALRIDNGLPIDGSAKSSAGSADMSPASQHLRDLDSK
jgi:hypothetical protein